MAKPLPPLTWFRSFEAAARHLSFTAAAQEIGMTQSAVSQQVKALESRLGAALFMRRARGLSLTDDGRKLLPKVESALSALSKAAAEVVPTSGPSALTIATSVSMAHWVLAPALPAFQALHPGVTIRFLSAIWPDDFHGSRADVEIRFGSEKQVGHGATMLTPNRLIAVRSPLLQGALTDLPLIESVGTSTGWAGLSDLLGMPLRPSLFVDSYGMALQLAVHGNGVALVAEVLAQQVIATNALERAHPDSIPSQEGYFLSINTKNPKAVAFRAWLMGVLGGQEL